MSKLKKKLQKISEKSNRKINTFADIDPYTLNKIKEEVSAEIYEYIINIAKNGEYDCEIDFELCGMFFKACCLKRKIFINTTIPNDWIRSVLSSIGIELFKKDLEVIIGRGALWINISWK